MRRGKFGKKPKKIEVKDHELTAAARSRETSPSNGKEVAQSTQEMSNLETILRELRDFCRENTDTLKEIKEELREGSLKTGWWIRRDGRGGKTSGFMG